jgi:hypothetical protein
MAKLKLKTPRQVLVLDLDGTLWGGYAADEIVFWSERRERGAGFFYLPALYKNSGLAGNNEVLNNGSWFG